MAMVHAQCAKKLSRLQSSAHVLFSFELEFTELACSTTTSMHASAECMLYEDTDSTILLRRTQTQTAATSFQHGGLPQHQRCIECIYFQVQTVATSSAKFSERIHVRHARHATATSTYVVLPAEATSTRLPPAPGQELRRHVRQLQVDSDAADIHSPNSFLPCSIYLP